MKKTYVVKKTMEIAVAHNLKLSYDSKCMNLHGHNLIVTVYLKSHKLNQDNMVMDFTHIKREIHDKLDHGYLNDIFPDVNPTAEWLGEWICNTLNQYLDDEPAWCFRVDVQESEGNVATFMDGEDCE